MRRRFAVGWVAGLVILSALHFVAGPAVPIDASAVLEQLLSGSPVPSRSRPAAPVDETALPPADPLDAAPDGEGVPVPRDSATGAASPGSPPATVADAAQQGKVGQGLPAVAVAPGTPSDPAPSTIGARAALSGNDDVVPILMYHYIRINPVATDKAGFALSITPSDFAAQMGFLAEHGFATVTMAQVRKYVRDGTPLPPNPVALTFDDGYDDAYTAAQPVLEAHHMTATFFVITGFLDHPRYMTWDQATSLDREGMEVASHTVDHRSLIALNAVLRGFEITSSRAELETHLGHPVLDFCYPSGEVNAAVEATVAQAGYLTATTTASGVARPGDDPLRLPRLRIWGGMPLKEFSRVMGVTH